MSSASYKAWNVESVQGALGILLLLLLIIIIIVLRKPDYLEETLRWNQ